MPIDSLVFISSGLPFCLHSPCPPLEIFLLWQNQPLPGAHCLLCFPQIASFHRGCTNSVVLYPIVTAATGTCLHMSPIKGWKCVSSCLCLQPRSCCLLELCLQKRANSHACTLVLIVGLCGGGGELPSGWKLHY